MTESPGPLAIPFDQYQRYRIVSEIAGAFSGGSGLRALDVGGYFQDLDGRSRLPLREFLPGFQTTVVDLAGAPLSGFARAHGSALPFKNGQFDLACCMDVLEHVPEAFRDGLIGELLRTSRAVVVLAAPFRSPLVERAEGLLAGFIERACGYVQGQLQEHRERGLPDLRTVRDCFARTGWDVHVFGFGNLWRWLFMMLDKHAVAALPGSTAVHRALDERYNRERFELDRDPPWYRHFLVAAEQPNHPALALARSRFPDVPDTSGTNLQVGDQVVELLFDLAELHAANQETQAKGEPQRRDAHVAAVEAHRTEMYRHLAAKDEYIAKLESMFRKVEGSYAYRAGRLLRKVIPK